jgi:alpha-amylase
MQSNALHEVYKMEKLVKQTNNPQIIEDWKKLLTSDHFYYMCTKYFSDGDVHKYFNPYESPYDSYINYMNVLNHLRERCKQALTEQKVSEQASAS